MSTSVFEVLCVGLTICLFEGLWNKIKGVFDYSVGVFFFYMISIFLPQIPGNICFRTFLLLLQSDNHFSSGFNLTSKSTVLELSKQKFKACLPSVAVRGIPIIMINKRVLYKSRRQFIIFHCYLS